MKNIKSLNTANLPRKFNSGLLVSGELFIPKSSMFGAEITLFENNSISQKYVCCLNGVFYFKLEYEKKYTIKVSKNDYETKTIIFDTSLNGHSNKDRYYEFGISLNPILKAKKHTSIIAAQISYNNKIDGFEHIQLNTIKNQISNNAA
jgi:hypothetical protein